MLIRKNLLTGLLLLTLITVSSIAPPVGHAGTDQTGGCPFDPTFPTVEHARESFRVAKYNCARLELLDLLAIDTVNNRTRADAHALMAAVQYATTYEKKERRQRTRREFIEVFHAFRYWRGELEIPEYEFKGIMKDARELVDWVYMHTPEPGEPQADTVETTTPATPPITPTQQKKPWYKKSAPTKA